MIFKAIETIELLYQDEPLLLEDCNTLRKNIEKIFASEVIIVYFILGMPFVRRSRSLGRA